MKKSRSIVQVGKDGVDEGVLERLKNDFKYRENVKVEVLGNNRNKVGVKKIEKEILEKLGDKFHSRIVGFCIFLKKLRKKQ